MAQTLLKRSDRSAPGKGQRTRDRIIEHALEIVEEHGVAALSQEAVARRAGLSQSALRHHFALKDDLIAAVLAVSFRGFYRRTEEEVLRPAGSPREKLMQLLRGHIDYTGRASDRIALEAFAYTLRDPDRLDDQSQWYDWLVQHYTGLLELIRPDLLAIERQEKAMALLTLCMGAWICAGKSRTTALGSDQGRAREALLRQAALLIDA